MAELPKKAKVVIIGGGVIGCSIAYHLTKIGWDDVVLLERKQLTSGTTWHAAGLVGQLRPSINMTKLAKYTGELYRGLEAETGQATGYRQCGSISMATNLERFEELKRSASMAKVFDLPVHVVTPEEIKGLANIVNVDDVVGGIHIPSDGYANAVDITQALAKGARTGGAKIFENTKVTKIRHNGDRVTGVDTAEGSIDADYVVICGGMWTRDLAASVGVAAPLHACEHYYVLFEGVEGIDNTLPVLRDYDYCGYYKYDAGKLLVGAFEPNARPWGMDGISEDFCFDEIAGSFEHFEPLLLDAMRRVPALEKAGIQKFFCGPESFTADAAPMLLVDADGGPTQTVTTVDSTMVDGSHRWPRFLPDGQHFVFTKWSNIQEGRSEQGGIFLGSLDQTPARQLLRDDLSALRIVGGGLPCRGHGIADRRASHKRRNRHRKLTEPALTSRALLAKSGSGIIPAKATSRGHPRSRWREAAGKDATPAR